MQKQTLSQLGQQAISNPIRADFDLFERVMQNEYHPTDNPKGDIPLCIAENLLGWPALKEKLQQISREKTIPDWVASYTMTVGHPDFRTELAKFLSRKLGGDALDPEGLAIAAGATSVIELTAYLLANPGDVAVIPGPAYTVYTGDIGNKVGVDRYDLHVPASEEHPGVYDLKTSHLDRAYEELGDRFKLLILTQPNNPTGQIFTEDAVFNAVTWCERHEVHCVVNEIYALSLIDQTHPAVAEDYPDQQWFVSCLSQLEQRNSDYFHWWYSFSKDFGVSGFRMGVLYSKNEALLQAWANYSAPVTTSNYNQWLLTELLRDEAWVDNFFANERPLTESYAAVVQTLQQLNIPYTPAIGSLFVWFDLSKYLTADTDEAWTKLWEKIYHETGCLLTYPLGMGGKERGWFRLVYSGLPLPTLEEALNRLGGYLDK